MTTSRSRLVLAFASGCATAAFAAWLGAELRAQAAADPAAGLLHACASADGVLHSAPVRAACPPGQQSLLFQKAVPPPPDGQPNPPSKDTTADRIKSLEQRVAALERDAATGMTHRVAAPFEVVDKDGRRVILVGDDHTVRLYDLKGVDVVRLEANVTGGELVARNGTGTGVIVGASSTDAGLKVVEGGGAVVRTDLGRSAETGNYRLLFFGADGQHRVAGIGESGLAAGLAFVSETNGRIRAQMVASASGGEISVSNKDRPVASLTEGKTGGGLLEIGNSGGERMVVAGVQPGGFGAVQAGPASFMQAAGLGLPGSYIAGKAK
jgi:hypothetical protein